MSIANNIKRLRESHDLTQTELGEIAGVTDKAVSSWETGAKTPRMGAIQKIADYFHINKSDIIEDELYDSNSITGQLDNIKPIHSDDEKPLDKNEKKIITAYRGFNDEGKEQLLDYVDTLDRSGKYKKCDESGVVQEENA